MGGGGSKSAAPIAAPKDVVTVANQPGKPAPTAPSYNAAQDQAAEEEKKKEQTGLGSTGAPVPAPAGVVNQASAGTLSSSAVLTG